jgi:hypothetical protein
MMNPQALQGKLNEQTSIIQQLSLETKNNDIKLKHIDVTDFNSIRNFCSGVEECHFLINNDDREFVKILINICIL